MDECVPVIFNENIDVLDDVTAPSGRSAINHAGVKDEGGEDES